MYAVPAQRYIEAAAGKSACTRGHEYIWSGIAIARLEVRGETIQATP